MFLFYLYFVHPEHGKIRVHVERDSPESYQVGFVVSDVLQAMGYKNISAVKHKLINGYYGWIATCRVDDPGNELDRYGRRNRTTTHLLMDKDGVHTLAKKSRAVAARAVEDWINAKILPVIPKIYKALKPIPATYKGDYDEIFKMFETATLSCGLWKYERRYKR